MTAWDERKLAAGHSQLESLFKNLIGKRIRFCLKNNNYDCLMCFDAILAGFSPCQQIKQIGSRELLDCMYRLENDRGIEIQFSLQKLLRVDEPDNDKAQHYFLIFEQHFWSLEVLAD